jgi:hypothetical protein
MRARLKEMRNLCGKLKEMVFKAKDRIEVESKLYNKISSGLDQLKVKADSFNPEEIRQRIKAEQNEPEEQSPVSTDFFCFKESVFISGLLTLADIKVSRRYDTVEVLLHVDTVSDVYKYDFTPYEFKGKEVRMGRKHLSLAVREEVLRRLYFTAQNGELELNYDESYPSGFITMICHIKGSPFQHTCVHISEDEDHVYINLDEPDLGTAL